VHRRQPLDHAAGVARLQMNARARWLPIESTTLTELAELPVVIAIVAAMLAVGVHSFARARQHAHVMETMTLVSGAKVAMVEYLAVTGTWPSSNEQAGYFDRSSEHSVWLSSVTIRPAGAVDFVFSARDDELSGKVLSFRAWSSADGSPIAWVCGRGAAASLVTASADRTTLRDDQLPSPCVAPL
jgi:type IV pilus assembly protein PilA